MNATLPATHVEPWLRATRTETPAVVRAVLHAIDLALENIEEATEGLTVAQIDVRPFGVASIGFHLRHLTGALDRSLTYASRRHHSAHRRPYAKTCRAVGYDG